jgi:hypothetical protein
MDARSSGNRFPFPAGRSSAFSPLRSALAVVRFVLPAALLAQCLLGCIVGGEKHAGVDEFPNSVYARVNGFLGESKKSEELGVPDLGDSLHTGVGFIVAAAKLAVAKIAVTQQTAGGTGALPALAKTAAGCSGLIGTWTDSLGKPGPLKLYTKDTLQVCLDAKAFDTVKNNETLIHVKSLTAYESGRIETAEISDADGDGIINPAAAAVSKASLIFTGSEKGVSEKTVLTVGPGPDNDYATESDNLVFAAFWAKTQGADTLARAVYADADSDGVAVDNGKASVVDLDLYQKGPSKDHPDALWSRAVLRMVVRYHVDAKEVRRVRFEMEDPAHRLSTGEILGGDGGPDFVMRDTVIAHFSTVGTAASDSLDTLDVRLTMKLGADFDSPADDTVYAIRAVSTQKSGDERRAEFAFISSKPILSGAGAEDGTISMAIEYRDGTSLTLDGTLKAKALDATIFARDGRKAHVTWDAEGRGVLFERLD